MICSLKRVASSADSTSSKVMKNSHFSQQTTPINVNTELTITCAEMNNYFHLIENDERISYLLNFDYCCRLADNYLLAMVFVYFKRANLTPRQFTRRNFYVALYLAHDMEEEDDEVKIELLKWALGYNWTSLLARFLKARDQLWNRINFRAIVSRKLCDEIISLVPGHFIWKRKRHDCHAGARRYSSCSSVYFDCTRCLQNALQPEE